MQKNVKIIGVRSVFITGFILVLGAFQLLSAQNLSNNQTATQSENLQFSQDDGLAFIEALEFCLTQIGSPIKFNESIRKAILGELDRTFYSLPPDAQLKLSTARTTWSQYKASWILLSMDQKRAFAYDVLALAFGDEAASQAIGLSPAVNEGKSYDDVKDDFCINNPGICP